MAMIDVSEVFSGWVGLVTTLCVVLGLLRWALQALGDDKSPRFQLAAEEEIEQEIEDLDLQVPKEPHVEIALDPPTGLHYSNPPKPYKYDNEFSSGNWVFFHKPTSESGISGLPSGMDYGTYFNGKKRLWELRIQFNFKDVVPAEEEIYFGLELEDYVPLPAATKSVASAAVTAVRKAVGPVYHSVGDDPTKVTGELERPICVLPLWAFDQFIETPEGEEPPSLVDPDFPKLGSRRYQRIRAYAEEIADLRQRIRPGNTYTFAFWGNSRWLDVLNWKLVGLPMVPPLDFDRFAGRPPVHCVIYGLRAEGDEPNAEKRHVQSRKNYYFRCAIWINGRRPELRRFEQLIGMEAPDSLGMDFGKKKRSLRSRISRFMKSQLQCCTTRPRG